MCVAGLSQKSCDVSVFRALSESPSACRAVSCLIARRFRGSFVTTATATNAFRGSCFATSRCPVGVLCVAVGSSKIRLLQVAVTRLFFTAHSSAFFGPHLFGTTGTTSLSRGKSDHSGSSFKTFRGGLRLGKNHEALKRPSTETCTAAGRSEMPQAVIC